MTLLVHEDSGRVVSMATDAAGAGATLAQTIWLSGEVAPPALCSGLGRCGACRVRFLQGIPEPVEADSRVLGEGAVAAGWRLSCRHRVRSGMEVVLPPPPVARTERVERVVTSCKVLLAVDLGTTSVQWQASDSNGVFLRGQALNPQMGAGSDVVSRLGAARTVAGRGVLRTLLLRFLQRIVAEVHAVAPDATLELCVAGNTAMTAILLDLDTSGLAVAPYHLPTNGAGGETVSLPGLPPVWVTPQPAPFVGGDISAGMATLLFGQEPQFPFLLADLGTNGECVLALDAERSVVTSVPLGPALEGIGLTHGGVAQAGSVSGFRLDPKGLTPQVIGGGSAERLCGTGYVSLLDILLRTGFLTPGGRLAEGTTPLARRLRQAVRFDAQGAWYLPLPGEGLGLTAFDVEEILKVKAAFSLALEGLLQAAGVALQEVRQVVLGGALGEHAPVRALETLGFLPSGLGARVRSAGNTSLAGAALLLARPELRAPLIRWSKQCQVLDLTAQADFTAQYMRHMVFG
ncbi:MAG: ASKHA domain-containing protein [Bilophila sp.]